MVPGSGVRTQTLVIHEQFHTLGFMMTCLPEWYVESAVTSDIGIV